MRVVATAGHVDHGKSTLVLALTGTDPDRFPEEKARGLTIDLGFAFTTLTSGQVVGFVDVPGHVRFVKNMLAGVGAVDVALLVVAANEGWMPQTEEHTQILRLLDIEHGVVVVTKCGIVDGETVEIARLELDDRLSGTPLASWPVVATDAPTGRGIEELRATLDAVLAAAPAPRDDGRPRLWIDRVFSAKGAGTIVTGTLTGGAITVDDEVFVEPGHRPARVRGLETHHHSETRAEPGARVALNLAGIDHDDVNRGDAVVLDDQWRLVGVLDVVLRTLPGYSFPSRAAVHAHVGSGQQPARLRLLDEHGRFGRLWLESPLPLAPGDRIVLRSSGRQATVGGALVVDVEPARRRADAVARLELPLGARVMAAHPWCGVAMLGPVAGVRDPQLFADDLVANGDAVRVGEWLVAPAELESLRGRVQEIVASSSGPGVELASLASTCGVDAARLRGALHDDPTLIIERDLVRDARSADLADDPDAQKLIAALERDPFSPPSPAETGATPSLVRALVGAGVLVDLDGVIFTTPALDEARARIVDALEERHALSVADIRDLLGSSRKYVIPLIARMDAEGVTRRRGDDRIAGPRAKPPHSVH